MTSGICADPSVYTEKKGGKKSVKKKKVKISNFKSFQNVVQNKKIAIKRDRIQKERKRKRMRKRD